MVEEKSDLSKICPCAITVALLSSKWKVLIMRDLLEGTYRYNQLRRSVSGISQKMLTQSLKEMQNDGLVKRKVYPEVPPRVEYNLTPLGESLRPVLLALTEWGITFKRNSDPAYLKKRFDPNNPKNKWLRYDGDEAKAIRLLKKQA